LTGRRLPADRVGLLIRRRGRQLHLAGARRRV